MKRFRHWEGKSILQGQSHGGLWLQEGPRAWGDCLQFERKGNSECKQWSHWLVKQSYSQILNEAGLILRQESGTSCGPSVTHKFYCLMSERIFYRWRCIKNVRELWSKYKLFSTLVWKYQEEIFKKCFQTYMIKGIVIMSSWTSNGEKGLGHYAQGQSACLVCIWSPNFLRWVEGTKRPLHSFHIIREDL